jgi:RND superfamily putative drug exporter
MGRVTQWAVRRPWYALLTWVGIMVVVGLVGTTFGGDYNDNFELPDTESTTAQELLSELEGGAGTGSGLEGQVVWKPDSGEATDGSAEAAATDLLTNLSTSSGVACVFTPFGEPLGSACPQQPADQGQGGQQGEQPQQELSPEAEGALAHFGQAGVSPDGTVAYSTVIFEGESLDDMSTDDVITARDLIEEQNGSDGLQVGANGLFVFVGGEPPSSESIGVAVALVILLFAFGSIVGAFLPITSAALSVALATTFALPLVARFFVVATFAPILASMIGLGVGIDYSLMVINRYREAIIHGRSPREAALESVRTSGRAVQFAAATVIIALLGLFVMRITFFNGIAVAAAITVLMVMVGALLLLPAVLSLLGGWAFVGRMAWITDREAIPKRRATGVWHTVGVFLRYLGWLLFLPVTLIGLAWRRIVHGGKAPDPTRPNAFARYGHWLQKRPWLTGAFALAVMVVIALPMLSLRLGFSDDSGTPEGSSPRIAYDLTAEGFGPGVNGPFYLAVELPDAGDEQAVTTITDALNADPGVALAAAAPVPRTPPSRRSRSSPGRLRRTRRRPTFSSTSVRTSSPTPRLNPAPRPTSVASRR